MVRVSKTALKCAGVTNKYVILIISCEEKRMFYLKVEFIYLYRMNHWRKGHLCIWNCHSVVLFSTVSQENFFFSTSAHKYFWNNEKQPQFSPYGVHGKRQYNIIVPTFCSCNCQGGLILPHNAGTFPPSAAKWCVLRHFPSEADVFVHSPKPCHQTDKQHVAMQQHGQT